MGPIFVRRVIWLMCALLVAQPVAAHASGLSAVAETTQTAQSDHCAPDSQPDTDCDECTHVCVSCILVGSLSQLRAAVDEPPTAVMLRYVGQRPPDADHDALFRPPIRA